MLLTFTVNILRSGLSKKGSASAIIVHLQLGLIIFNCSEIILIRSIPQKPELQI